MGMEESGEFLPDRIRHAAARGRRHSHFLTTFCNWTNEITVPHSADAFPTGCLQLVRSSNILFHNSEFTTCVQRDDKACVHSEIDTFADNPIGIYFSLAGICPRLVQRDLLGTD